MCVAIVVLLHLLSFIMITTLAITRALTMRIVRAVAGGSSGECGRDSMYCNAMSCTMDNGGACGGSGGDDVAVANEVARSGARRYMRYGTLPRVYQR